MDLDDDDLETSWIEEQDKLNNIEQVYNREPLKYINMFFIYINENKEVDNIIREKYKINTNNETRSLLSKEILLQFIQQKKKKTKTSKYRFNEIVLYNVDIESDKIQAYSENPPTAENIKPFVKVISFINDVHIPDSIFIFHETTSLFFFFQETPYNTRTLTKTAKSILKTTQNQYQDKRENIQIYKGLKSTKKVRFDNVQKFIHDNTNTTRKQFT